MADDWLDKPYSLRDKKIWVAGHRGMVGSALLRRLEGENSEVLTCDFDFRRQAEVEDWMAHARPDVVIIAAAKVGGIAANRDAPADFLYDNIMIAGNIIHAAAAQSVERLLFLGSSCIYPKDAAQPIPEDALLGGALEETNEAYALAKIAGVKLCAHYRAQKGCDFISAMPCNLYGAGDRFDAVQSHVIPALMMKMHAAKISHAPSVQLWGSGTPMREFMHVDDLAYAIVFLLQRYASPMPINVGSSAEVSIASLADIIACVVGYDGDLIFDSTQPDGVMRKVMDSSRLNDAGWNVSRGLEDGLRDVYDWYRLQL